MSDSALTTGRSSCLYSELGHDSPKSKYRRIVFTHSSTRGSSSGGMAFAARSTVDSKRTCEKPFMLCCVSLSLGTGRHVHYQKVMKASLINKSFRIELYACSTQTLRNVLKLY